MSKYKGQYSAPFELLVAMIVLIMVIAIAMNTLDIIKKRDCSSRTNKSLTDLKVALERAVTENAPSDFVFELPLECAEKTSVKLKPYGDTEICSSACGGAKKDCVLLEYVEYQFLGGASSDTSCPGPNCAPVSGKRVCVEIPTTTTFLSQENISANSKCADLTQQNLVLKSFYKNIELGRYKLLNRTPIGESAFPVLCAYHEEI